MKAEVYRTIAKGKTNQQKFFALLIDPDKTTGTNLIQLVQRAVAAGVDFFFIGGSLLVDGNTDMCIATIREHADIPTVLFPGSLLQVSPKADALLLLSLISGRNPELLIGQHVVAAPMLAKSQLEIIPTGYMLVDGGQPTSVSYMSNTTPLPANKPDIAAVTAMAGEMLGLKLIYTDAGSGASNSVSPQIIKAIHKYIDIPIVVGGGIRTVQEIKALTKAGADVIVVGNAIENDIELLEEMVVATKQLDK